MDTLKNNFKFSGLLRLFLGLVFVSAGFYRILNWRMAVSELSGLNIDSSYISIFIVAIEIIGGIFLIFNIKTKKVLSIFIVFVLLALVAAFLAAGKDIISGFEQLFTFSPTPTDVFLHFTYLIILVYLLGEKER